MLHDYLVHLACLRGVDLPVILKVVAQETAIDPVTLANLRRSALQLRTIETLSMWIEKAFRQQHAATRSSPTPRRP